MENSLLFVQLFSNGVWTTICNNNNYWTIENTNVFGEIWPETMYYSTGTLAQFLSNF